LRNTVARLVKQPLGVSDSQHFQSLRRGGLRAFWGLKTENGVFFRTEAFLRLNSLFSLDFLKRHFPARTRPYKRGADQGGELPRYVPNKPCIERASACQARACIGAEGFIHSEESVERTRLQRKPSRALTRLFLTLSQRDTCSHERI